MIKLPMNFLIITMLFFSASCLSNRQVGVDLDLQASNVIYGADDRSELYDVEDVQYQQWAKSTAVMIGGRSLLSRFTGDDGVDYVRLFGRTFSSWIQRHYGKPLCEDAESIRFAEQKVISNCSGVLVAPDLILTAGHCLPYPSSCYTHKWVFGVQASADEDKIVIPASNIYGCREIVTSIQAEPQIMQEVRDCFERGECSEEDVQDYSETNEYALVRLDRAVTDRDYLSVRTSGKIDQKANLIAIGNPFGLSTKVAENGHVRPGGNVFEHFFLTNLDVSVGNSGSPVINVDTGVVEGVVIRGEDDFIEDESLGCLRDLVADDNYGHQGEAITRTTSIPELMDLYQNDI